MFSKKTDLYKSIEGEIVLDVHRESLRNLRVNLKLRYLCIVCIIFAMVTPWYYFPGTSWSNVYLYMICTDDLVPTDCISFYTIEENCPFDSQELCEKCKNEMNGGYIVLIGSLVCILLQVVSIINLYAFIGGKNYCKTTCFCVASSVIYCLTFVAWNNVSDFRPSEYTAFYGLTAAFTCMFLQIFLSLHFITFTQKLIGFFSAESGEASHSESEQSIN